VLRIQTQASLQIRSHWDPRIHSAPHFKSKNVFFVYFNRRNRNVFPAHPRRRRVQPGQGRRVQLGRVDQGEIVTESSSSTCRPSSKEL
jgi:hypothetical protein